MLYIFCKVFLAWILWIVFRPRIFGRENLFVSGAAVICCNHRKMIDPILLGLICPRPIHFMAKKQLFDNEFLAVILKLFLVFPVNRKSTDMHSLKKALGVLEKGKIFGIFPEGKRAITNDMDMLEKGAAFLALKSGAPIIPVYIHPDSFVSSRPIVIVGSPIKTTTIIPNVKKSTLAEVITNEITNSINALRIELDAKLYNN